MKWILLASLSIVSACKDERPPAPATAPTPAAAAAPAPAPTPPPPPSAPARDDAAAAVRAQQLDELHRTESHLDSILDNASAELARAHTDAGRRKAQELIDATQQRRAAVTAQIEQLSGR
jgi:hypothetical protein